MRALARLGPFALALGGVALAALVLRVAYTLAVAGDTPLNGDGLENVGIATGVADGRGYVLPLVFDEEVPTAHKPPLYPLFLAAVARLGFEGHVPFQLASVLLGVLTVVVVGLLARRIAGPRAGIIAAALAAVYPIFLITDASLRAETPYALLVALALLAAYRAAERPSAGRMAVLGAVVGLAALTRTEALALLVLLGVPVLARGGRTGRGRGAAVLVAVCALVLLPWFVRCWIVFDQPVLVSTNSGDLLAGANCAETYAGPSLGAWVGQCLGDDPTRGSERPNEAVTADRLRRQGLDYAREHARRLPVVVAARVGRTWSVFRPEQQLGIDLTEGRSRRAGQLGRWACYGLLGLALAGALVLRRRGAPLLLLAAPVVLVVLVSALAYGVTRFRIPADVVLVVLAAVALDAVLRRRTASGVTAPRRAARPASRGPGG